MRELILKYALINAVGHNGKADIQAVLGKILAEKPDLKSKIKEILPEIKKIVEEVNSLSVDEQKKRFNELGIVVERKKVEEFALPELPNAIKGKVVMRLAPFPSGPLHIGNARMVILNDEYVKRYDGKLLLVYDDTIGSEEKFIIPEAYKMIKEGLDWLGVKYHKVFYKSDRLKFFYDYATQLIEKDLAYVCTCSVEQLRKNRKSGVECHCRSNSTNENLELWRDMLLGKIKEGRATVRLKTDMQHPNPAFRDRVLLRIVEREHPRVGRKYRVWPTLEFSWAIDDYLLGITHILRGKDLMIEDMTEEFIWNKMGWKKCEFVHYGLLNIEEAKLSKTAVRKAIEKGVYSGWEDPRTWSIQSLMKRGIQPQAIRKFIVNMGLSLADVKVPAEILYAENRKIIDPIANRYFAVLEPTKISVEGAPKMKEVKAALHPDFPKRGTRRIPLDTSKIYIEKADLKKFCGQEVGLMNLFTIINNKISKFVSKEVKYDVQKIHWVSEPNVKIKIVMPDASVKQAIAEPDVRKLEVGDVIQLCRVGFCRVDKAGEKPVLYFAHK
jgi:glutamyl-tRNA synthetase